MFGILLTGCSRGGQGSFLVENKCMARGSLKTNFFSFAYNAMVAHIPPPNPMAKKITVYRRRKNPKQKQRRKKESRTDEFVSFPSLLQCCCFFLFISQPMYLLVFQNKCSFFGDRNTKLPDTARFTQATQSTTAFNSATGTALHTHQGRQSYYIVLTTGLFFLCIFFPQLFAY